MHAKQSQQPLHPSPGGAERPLATSAFKGQARLRELEHLANTARKVRDQAASELTRGGSTHHIARDRISAAERMLKKTQQEIAELRAQLGPLPDTAVAKPKDFELAMMLGHSKATFNRDEAGQTVYEIQQDAPARSAKTSATGKPASHSDKHTKSAWRTLTFAVLISLGAGMGATGTYVVATTGSLTDASQVLRDGALQLVEKLRAFIPAISAPASANLAPVTANTTTSDIPMAAVTEPRSVSAQQIQEQQARAAAEQRLARQIAGLK